MAGGLVSGEVGICLLSSFFNKEHQVQVGAFAKLCLVRMW